jgi:hypothetical protein
MKDLPLSQRQIDPADRLYLLGLDGESLPQAASDDDLSWFSHDLSFSSMPGEADQPTAGKGTSSSPFHMDPAPPLDPVGRTARDVPGESAHVGQLGLLEHRSELAVHPEQPRETSLLDNLPSSVPGCDLYLQHLQPGSPLLQQPDDVVGRKGGEERTSDIP